MKLIVGLGNPGRDYAGTRHNIGFEVIDRLAWRLGLISGPADFDRVAKSNFDGLAMNGTLASPGGGEEKTLLLKPMTFMNLSGRSVQSAMAFYRIAPADVMIVLDDLALPCGKIRLRANGSSGGHNGLKDIERALATNQYPRLRLGIDAPPPRVPGRDYVLGKFSDVQISYLEPAIIRAMNAILCWIESGMQTAMNRFNADPDEKKVDRRTT
ncbi:MAG TPA: aminoacyl-tRNA hydrolase [Tepidisphaeraceae bacterium]|jgi:PTH1 family peptidyl-tRNA hydrolase|nr:aminoacyl-tRNA hydrolase [Tepidisphaeraceae bacterium]